MSGPLAGVRVLELQGMGPLPFAGMLLSDLGADVVRIDRVAPRADALVEHEPVARGRRSVALDLNDPDAVATFLRLCENADAVIEGFRPGVAERLGIGPEPCRARNPRLVYGRMTGWGQDGPLAQTAGHDINYIALAGALHGIGTPERPVPPGNIVGDFAGGGMVLALGVVSALLEARASGQGQVVDAAIVDGAALLTTAIHELIASGEWSEERGSNVLDGGAGHYDVYETADHQFVAIGALESRFHDDLCARLGVEVDRTAEPAATRSTFAKLFATRTRQEWCDLLEGTDACFAPVLSPTEAARHPANRARNVFVEIGGVTQPAPAPRFSRTPTRTPVPGAPPGTHTRAVLGEWGFDTAEIDDLLASGAAAERPQSSVNERNS
ncbi:CaiB/BaiF CoA transferase family protein [Rhodococcus oryzae]|uniref:CaiB/BaiF CoA transferase family protein n=1 Tax=Rhodococcus oryzae TaxID=2571143 RepID=UPI0037156E89